VIEKAGQIYLSSTKYLPFGEKVMKIGPTDLEVHGIGLQEIIKKQIIASIEVVYYRPMAGYVGLSGFNTLLIEHSPPVGRAV